MSLEGRLEDANLLEVIRLLHSGTKEGKLTLQSEDKIGFVVFQTGEIIGAKLGSVLGEDAIYQMTLWEKGSFRFDHERVTQARALTINHPNLMIEASRRFSEWKAISKKIPSLDMIPEFVPQTNPEAPQVSLSTNEWVLLSKVDGHRNIRTISEGSKFGVFETCKIFYGLISSGLLRVRAPVPTVPAPPPPPPRPKSNPAVPTFGFGGATSEPPSRPKSVAVPTFGFGGSSAPEPPPPPPPAAKTAPSAASSKTVSLEGIAQALKDVGEKYLGSFASGIIEKSLRKARVDLADSDTERQSYNFKRSIDLIQKASATILGPELAAQMASELDDAIEQRIRA